MENDARMAAMDRTGGPPPEMEGEAPMAEEPQADPVQVLGEITMVLESMLPALPPELQDKVSQAVALLGGAAAPKQEEAPSMGADAGAYGEAPTPF